MCKDIKLLLLPLMECLSQKNITLQVSCVKCGCDPWQTRRASQGKPSGNRDTLQEAREQWEQPGWGGGGGDTCWIRRFYATECDGNWSPNISQLLVACTNTLPSINTVTWHRHTLLYKCTLTRWLSHIPDLVSAVLTFPATHYTSWPTHTGTHTLTLTLSLTNSLTHWPWLSVVSRSADTWKDALERGPFHSNSAQQHLAQTQCFTTTVVKGMRVLNSMAAHSSLPTEWGKKSLSWTQHSNVWTLTHTPKQSLTRRPLWVRDLKFEWKNKWELEMSVKYFWLCSNSSHSKCWSSAAATERTHEKSQRTKTGDQNSVSQ